MLDASAGRRNEPADVPVEYVRDPSLNLFRRAERGSFAYSDGAEAERRIDEIVRGARDRSTFSNELACAITDYDPYDPPRIAVSAQFLGVTTGARSDADIDRLVQSASWRRGPLTMSRDRAGHALALFEEVYDAHDQATRKALQAYARRHADSAFVREHEYLAVQSRYLQFVSLQVISRTLEILSAHGS